MLTHDNQTRKWLSNRITHFAGNIHQPSASAKVRRQNEMLNWHHLRRCQNLHGTYDLRNGCRKHICKPNGGSEPLNLAKLFKKSRRKRYNKSFFHKKPACKFLPPNLKSPNTSIRDSELLARNVLVSENQAQIKDQNLIANPCMQRFNGGWLFLFFCSEVLSYQLRGYLRNHVYILGPSHFHCSSG